MLTLTGFGKTSLSGVRRGFMPPQLNTKQKYSFKKDLTQLCSYLLLYTVWTVSTIYGNGSPQSFPFTSICEQNKLHVLTDGQATFISGTNLFSFAPSMSKVLRTLHSCKTLTHPFQFIKVGFLWSSNNSDDMTLTVNIDRLAISFV